MKLTAQIAGETHELNIRRDGVCVIAEIKGRRYELEAHQPEPGVYLLIAGGHIYECQIDRDTARPDAFDVRVDSRTYAVTVFDPKRLRGAQASGARAADGIARIVAPMPGKVVRVMVERGARVEAGDGLLVVEAMKMQNEMKSPKSGTVVKLHATAGATVNAGDVLAVVE